MHNHFKRFFFINYMAIGALMPYLALFLSRKGIRGAQLGLLLGVLPLVKVIAQPLWGMLSDARQVHRPVLTGTLFGVAAAGLLLMRVDGFWMALAVVIVFGVLDAAHLPLGIMLAIDYLERKGQVESFGPLRMWGSVGYMVASVGVGALVLERHLPALPSVFAGLMAAAGVLSLRLPRAGSPSAAFHWKDGVRLVTGNGQFALLLAGLALAGATLGAGQQYLPIYLEDLRAAGWMIGLSVGIQAALELPLMANAPRILRRIGAPAALMTGIAVLPARWLLHVLVALPAALLPVQLLHGMTISGVMVAGALYINRLLPAHLRATGQAVYNTAFAGVGWSLGLLMAGVVYDAWGIRAVWLALTLCAALAAGIVGYVLRERNAADL